MKFTAQKPRVIFVYVEVITPIRSAKDSISTQKKEKEDGDRDSEKLT
jgi:hypothetical protein